MDTAVGLTGLVPLLCVLCALVAVRAPGLIAAALWLAGTSACLALTLYLLDAPYAAVIELSVGAGLVAVLFVLAVTTVGDSGSFARPQIPGWLAGALAMLCIGILGWLLQPNLQSSPTGNSGQVSFARIFWEQRALDVIGQLVLLFVAALGVRVLLGQAARPPTASLTDAAVERRTNESAGDPEAARSPAAVPDPDSAQRQHEVPV
jgi:NADH:ubiquinone oxidoreductase subunit 6 (subunit J)